MAAWIKRKDQEAVKEAGLNYEGAVGQHQADIWSDTPLTSEVDGLRMAPVFGSLPQPDAHDIRINEIGNVTAAVGQEWSEEAVFNPIDDELQSGSK